MSKKLIFLLSNAIFLSTIATTPVFAATHKPAKMTCEEFLVLDDVVKPKIVYWAEGFNKKGKPDEVVFDVENTDNYYPVVVTTCEKAPKSNLISTIKKVKTDHPKH